MIVLDINDAKTIEYTITDLQNSLDPTGDWWIWEVDTDKLHYPNGVGRWKAIAHNDDYWITHSIENGEITTYPESPRTYISELKNARFSSQ